MIRNSTNLQMGGCRLGCRSWEYTLQSSIPGMWKFLPPTAEFWLTRISKQLGDMWMYVFFYFSWPFLSISMFHKIKPNDSHSIFIVLRNISILLCRDSQYSSLGGLLGGLYPDIPSFLPRSIYWPGSRRWLFPATLVCRFHLGCDWDIHRFFCDYILAIITLTRCLRRYWIWNDL